MTPFCELQVISYKVYPAQISQESFKARFHHCILWYSTGPPVHHQNLLGMVQAQERSRPGPKNFSGKGRIKSQILVATQAAVRRGEGAWLLMRQKQGRFDGKNWDWHLGIWGMRWDGMGLVCCVCCVMSEKQWLLDLSEIFSDIA